MWAAPPRSPECQARISSYAKRAASADTQPSARTRACAIYAAAQDNPELMTTSARLPVTGFALNTIAETSEATNC